MSGNVHKAPPGKYVVGEAFYAENEWAQIGDPFDTLGDARALAEELNAPKRPELEYFVYDETGLLPETAHA